MRSGPTRTYRVARIPSRLRILLIKRSVVPLLNQHMDRWAFSKERAKTLDRTQRKMLSVCLRLVAGPDESAEDFYKRRRVLIKAAQEQMGCWSIRWAKRLQEWSHTLIEDEEFGRSSWPSQLTTVRPPNELAERRSVWGRPRTRALPGFFETRWCESIDVACEFLK